jgi:hypothetical protein
VADRHEKLFWIIPLSALIVASIIGAGTIEYKMNTVLPNAEIELLEIKSMTCSEIKARNSIGSYWTPGNGEFARDKVDACLKAEKAHKAHLKEIRDDGTHQEKIDAGFTKLWFGAYSHPKLPDPKPSSPSKIVIPLGTMADESLYPSGPYLVIIDYNNTIGFKNEDDTAHWITETNGEFGSWGVIKTNETQSITIEKPGVYTFYGHPWLQGTIIAMPYDLPDEIGEWSGEEISAFAPLSTGNIGCTESENSDGSITIECVH